MEQGNPIYRYLKEEGLTDLPEQEFVSKYTDRAELKQVFNYLKDNGNTDLGFEEFSDKYFPIPKSNEVSSQGSEVTSETSLEPLRTSPDTRSGGIEIPEGYELIDYTTEEGQAFGLIDQEGEVYNLLDSIEVTAPNNKEVNKDVKKTFGEYLSNSWSNMVEQLKTTPERMFLTSVASYQKIFGATLGLNVPSILRDAYGKIVTEQLYGVTGRDVSAETQEAYANMARVDRETKEVASIVDSWSNGDIVGVSAGVVDGAINIIGTVVTGVASLGGTIVTDLVGEALVEANNKKAEVLGITVEELYKRGQEEINTPLVVGGIGAMLEVVGLQGIGTAITRNIGRKSLKDIALFGLDVNKEGLTEVTQEALSIYNEMSVAGASLGEITEKVADFITSKDALEVYLKAVSGAGAIAGSGRVAKGITSKQTRDKITSLREQISSLAEDINKEPTQQVKDVIIDKVNSIAEQIQEETQIESKTLDKLSNEQIVEVSNLVEDIDSLQEQMGNEGISDASKTALQERIDVTQEQIDSITSTVDDSATEIDTNVVGELSNESFFSTLTDTDQRNARLTELEGRLKQLIQEESNLGISQDPKQKAKKDLEFLRDLTEYAVLKIADGTIDSVEAFTEAVKGLGDFGQEVINKAFNNAKEVAQDYVDTRPTETQVGEAQGSVLTRMQDVTVDRTPSTSKVTTKTVKDITEGKIQGKVTLTNKQALTEQIRTLNRGAKDAVKNVKAVGETLRAYVDSNKKDLKGLAFTQSEYRALANIMSGLTDEKRLGKAIEVVDKAIKNAEFRKKLGNVKRNQTALKKKPFPTDLKTESKKFADINPRDLVSSGMLDTYIDMLESLNKAGIKPTDVSVEQMRMVNDIADSYRKEVQEERQIRKEEREADPEYKAKQVQKKKDKLKELGMTDDEIAIIDSENKTVDQVIEELASKIEEIKPTRLDVIKDTSKKLLDGIRNNLNTIKEQITKSDAKKLDKFLANIDLSTIEDRYFLPLNYVLNNILNNNSINGLGNFLVMAEATAKLKDRQLVDSALGNFRKVKEGVDQLRKKQLATLYTRIERLVRDTRFIGDIHKFFGFQEYDKGSKKVKLELQNLKKDIHNIINKYKRKDSNYWKDPYNSTLSGVYTILAQYRQGWTPEEISQNYSDRLRAVVESLDRLRNEKATSNTKAYDTSIDVLTKIVEDLVDVTRDSDGSIVEITPKKSLQEIWTELPDGYKEYYNYTRNFFDKNKEEFFTITRMFSKEDVETDWVNYFPMSYTDYTRREGTNLVSKSPVDLTEVINSFNIRSATVPTSSAGISRTIAGKMLPKDKIFNFDLLGNFEREAGKILTDVNTMESKWLMNIMTDVRNNGMLGSVEANFGSIMSYRDIITDRIANDQQLVNARAYGDPNAITVVGGVLRTLGTIRTLGGGAQFVKQTTPLSEVAGRLKNPMSMVQALNLLLPHNRHKVEHIMKNADTNLRANQESLFSISQHTASLNKEAEKGLRGLAKGLGMGYQDLLNKAGKISLYPLIATDKYIAEVGWLSLYIDNSLIEGKDLNLESLNENAVSYADLTNSVIMNASDPSMQGDYSKSAFKWIQPMMGFSLNTIHNLFVSFAKLRDAIATNDTENIVRHSKEVVGNTVNAILFVGISWATRLAGMMAGKYVVEGVIKLWEDDEEKEKELLTFAQEEFGKRRLLNDARTINYAVNDMLFRGIFSDVTTPMIGAMNEFIGVQDFLFGKEELKKAEYTYAPYSSTSSNPFVNAIQSWTPYTGVIGMGLTSLVSSGENIVDMFKTQEDFIKQRRAIATADGKDIVTDLVDLSEEGIAEYGMPEYMLQSNYMAGIMAIVSLTGISDQTTNTMLRNTKSAVKKMVEKDKGKGKTGNWEKKLKEDVVSFNSYKVLGEEVKLTPDEMRKYSEQYLKEVQKIRDNIGTVTDNLTITEVEKAIGDMARSIVNVTIISDNQGEFETRAKRMEAKKEKEFEMRDATIKLQKALKGNGKTDK